MTRDSPKLHGDLDHIGSDAYSALWTSTPFPRVPDDAPLEIKNLSVEIHDPKRVYAIHKAARRYQFQLLVERYMFQVRYGCHSKTCHNQTCFSYRERVAAGAPIRRYNVTSARTLAIYLASQDDPEQGLCSHSDSKKPTERTKISVNSRAPPADGVEEPLNIHDGLKIIGNTENVVKSPPIPKVSRSSGIKSMSSRTREMRGAEHDYDPDDELSQFFAPLIFDPPMKTDHRSFAQNLFGTAAFKLVEWLTPRNVQILSAIVESRDGKPHPPLSAQDSSVASDVVQSQEAAIKALMISPKTNLTRSEEPPARHNESLDNPRAASRGPPSLKGRPNPVSSHPVEPFHRPQLVDKPSLQRRSSHVRTSSDSIDSHISSKNFISMNSKATDTETNHFTSVKSPKSKFIRQAVISTPPIRLEESQPSVDVKPKGTKVVTEEFDRNAKTSEMQNNEAKLQLNDSGAQDSKTKPRKKKKAGRILPTTKSLPQSLSSLPFEVIQILCDILESNEMSEKHNLQPTKVLNEFEVDILQQGKDVPIIKPSISASQASNYLYTQPRSTRLQWLGFAEQSFFDVLGRPQSLLDSFRRNGKLFDNHSIWYLMLRMTRVAPSLIFDALWRSSESLFSPPKELDSSCDWGKQTQFSGCNAQTSLSNIDAAHITSLCLHALVASAPLVRDSRTLMNMSRIRSYGLAMVGQDATALEPTTLCLQYEDAFSDEFAMRLARRLFASIPTRRKFAELLELQKPTPAVAPESVDILDAVLETLKLDPTTLPIIHFAPADTQIHDARICTLILDWARTVMLQEWKGSAEVLINGPFGGALMTVAAIYKNRKSLLLGDIHFRTQYFSDRLDPISMPRDWLNFEANKKTVHLLDYPYLFHPETLVSYFRAINFARMNHAYETSKASHALMSTAMAGSHHLMINRQRRERLMDQLRTATTTFLILEIRRTDVLLDTFNSIWRREERELTRPIKVRLGENAGEEGMDAGGVQQEYFGLAMAEALDPNYGTFTVDDRTRMTWFQPSSPEPLWKFELIGIIISLAVYNGLTIPVTFPKALYHHLLDQDVTELHHIADGWPDLASGLTTLLEWNESDGTVEDIFARTYEFSNSQYGQPISCDMSITSQWPQFPDLSSHRNPEDAPLVTNENRNNYVSDYILWLTDVSIRPQLDAFKRGFFTCLSPRTIKVFDASTLQSLVEGEQEIDISELRRVTRYNGWDSSHHTVRDFWFIVKRYNLEQKRKLLEFCTATDRVPVGGMRNMQFTLQRNGGDDKYLPTSATCFGILLLPEYSTREVLEERLGMALENSKGFGML